MRYHPDTGEPSLHTATGTAAAVLMERSPHPMTARELAQAVYGKAEKQTVQRVEREMRRLIEADDSNFLVIEGGRGGKGGSRPKQWLYGTPEATE